MSDTVPEKLTVQEKQEYMEWLEDLIVRYSDWVTRQDVVMALEELRVAVEEGWLL